MKYRSSFVSNSSSSSFIVAFPKPVSELSVEDVRELLFGGQKHVEYVYDDGKFSTRYIAEIVRQEAIEQEPLNPFVEGDREKLIDEVDSGRFEGYPEYPRSYYSLRGEELIAANISYYKIVRATAERRLEDFVNKTELDRITKLGCDWDNKPSYYYVFEYSDNDGDFWAHMEHGSVFQKLPHMRISKH